MKTRRFAAFFLLLFCMSLTANAMPTAARLEGAITKFNSADFTGYICWNISCGKYGQYDYERHEEKMKALNLEDGKSKTFDVPGYIIDRDINEYPGVLFASEKDGILTITHQHPSGINEVVFEGDAPVPVEFNGRQTVRAFMGGYVYYLKAMEPVEYEETIHQAGAVDEWVEMKPACVSVQLCRYNSQAVSYEYHMRCTFGQHNVFDMSPISDYSISSTGNVAWIEKQFNAVEQRYTIDRIWIETPNGDCRILLDGNDMLDAGYDMRIVGDIAWLDDETLIVFASPNSGDSVWMPFKVDVNSGGFEQVCDTEGHWIETSWKVAPGSGVAVNEDGTMLAYLTQPSLINHGEEQPYKGNEDNYHVPVVLDLLSGKTHHIYEYKVDDEGIGEYRGFQWGIVWHY